jgi:hypothetical protein
MEISLICTIKKGKKKKVPVEVFKRGYLAPCQCHFGRLFVLLFQKG